MHKGSCICQKVQFEIQGNFEGFFFCHCSRCRKASGSAHGANLFAKDATLRWTAGADLVRFFQYPETRFTRAFCQECGGALPNEEAGGFVKAPAGSLDTPVHTPPTAHIFMQSKANWDNHLELAPKFDGFPIA